MDRSPKYTLYFSRNAWGWTELELFAELAKYLTRIGRPTRLQPVQCFSLRRRRLRAACEIPISFAFLQNERTGEYGAMVCEDEVRGSWETLVAIANDPRCQVILKQQYRAEAFRAPWAAKVRPWIYLPSFPALMQPLLPELRRAERTQPGLYFRGNVQHARREAILEPLAQAGVLSTASHLVSFEQYCTELSAHEMALALPGWGSLCHREIEAFALGTPVLMPRQANQLHDDLVPDHHYVSVPVDVDTASEQDIAGAILSRYLETRNSPHLLRHIAANAMSWYDANAAFPNALRLTAELLGVVAESGATSTASRAPRVPALPARASDCR